MSTPRLVRDCACGKQAAPRSTQCADCKRNDPHRHGKRRLPETFVAIDCEGMQDSDNIMRLVTMSYGREDGTRGSISDAAGLDPTLALAWLIRECSGPYKDETGRTFRQALTSFHFTWDSSVLAKEFNKDLEIVHKAGARKTGRLCNTRHTSGDECDRIHRTNQETAQAVITEGGEGDYLAHEPVSHLAIATTPKRRFYCEYRPHGDRYDGYKAVDIHDSGPAFTGSLLQVIDQWQPAISAEDLARIEWGKGARKTNPLTGESGFADAAIQDVEGYSEAECVAYARCCRLLLDNLLKAAKVPMSPSKLYGAGSLASTTLKYHAFCKSKESHMNNTIMVNTSRTAKSFGLSPMRLESIAEMTYFGGKIEAPVIGRVTGTINELDINSAYPSQMIKLPCMRAGHGQWRVVKGEGRIADLPDGVGHVLAGWSVETITTPPFMVRLKSGSVCAPLQSVAWVSLPEFRAAKERFPTGVFGIEAVIWECGCDCDNPLAFMAELYDRRSELKRQQKACTKGSPEWQSLNVQQMSVKLVINSMYGKLAQRRPDIGTYTNMHYASYITGATRAQLNRETWAREAQGGTVIYQHTDSVLSQGGSPVDEGPALGAWSQEPDSHDMLIMQPGLATALGGGKTATRGAKKGEFVTAAMAYAETEDLTQHPTTWKPMLIERTMMVSRRTAMARGKPELAGAFIRADLEVGFSSAKRDVDKAKQMPGNPEAWIVPPVPSVYHDEIATLEDVRIQQSKLARLIRDGDLADGEYTPSTLDVIKSPISSWESDTTAQHRTRSVRGPTKRQHTRHIQE